MILHTDKASQETYYQRFYQNAKRNYSLEKIKVQGKSTAIRIKHQNRILRTALLII